METVELIIEEESLDALSFFLQKHTERFLKPDGKWNNGRRKFRYNDWPIGISKLKRGQQSDLKVWGDYWLGEAKTDSNKESYRLHRRRLLHFQMLATSKRIQVHISYDEEVKPLFDLIIQEVFKLYPEAVKSIGKKAVPREQGSGLKEDELREAWLSLARSKQLSITGMAAAENIQTLMQVGSQLEAPITANTSIDARYKNERIIYDAERKTIELLYWLLRSTNDHLLNQANLTWANEQFELNWGPQGADRAHHDDENALHSDVPNILHELMASALVLDYPEDFPGSPLAGRFEDMEERGGGRISIHDLGTGFQLYVSTYGAKEVRREILKGDLGKCLSSDGEAIDWSRVDNRQAEAMDDTVIVTMPGDPDYLILLKQLEAISNETGRRHWHKHRGMIQVNPAPVLVDCTPDMFVNQARAWDYQTEDENHKVILLPEGAMLPAPRVFIQPGEFTHSYFDPLAVISPNKHPRGTRLDVSATDSHWRAVRPVWAELLTRLEEAGYQVWIGTTQSKQAATKQKEPNAGLHKILEERFTLEEFRVLCFELGVNYDNLWGETISGKAVALIQYFEQRLPNDLAMLETIVQKKRPGALK